MCDIYMYVWTICRDVKLQTMWFSDLPRSCHYDLHGAVAHSWVHCQWSYSWVGRISGLIIPAYLQRSYFLDMGRGQPKNHLAEQFAILLHWLFHVQYYFIFTSLNFTSCTIRTLPQSETYFNHLFKKNEIHYIGYGDGSLLILLRVFSPTHSCQVQLDCFCTQDAFHNRIRNDSSEQVRARYIHI